MKPADIHQTIDFLFPPTSTPLFSAREVQGFEYEVRQLQPTPMVRDFGISIHGKSEGPISFAALARKVDVPDLDIITNIKGAESYGHTLSRSPMHRFICSGTQRYASIIPQLMVRDARVQVISDTLEVPYNRGGLQGHTDLDPHWSPAFKPDGGFILTAMTCSIDPGTKVVRMHRPLAQHTAFGHLVRRRVRQNKGPKPAELLRAMHAGHGQASQFTVASGQMGSMSSHTIHWRGAEDIGTQQDKRRFAALDFVIELTPRNRLLLRKLAAKIASRQQG